MRWGIECAYPAHKIGSNFLKMAKGFALTCQRRIKVPYGELISRLEDGNQTHVKSKSNVKVQTAKSGRWKIFLGHDNGEETK